MKQAQLNRVPGDAQAVGLRNHTLGSTAPEQWLSRAVLPTGDMEYLRAFLIVMTWRMRLASCAARQSTMCRTTLPISYPTEVLGNSAEDQKLYLGHLALTFMEEALSLSK